MVGVSIKLRWFIVRSLTVWTTSPFFLSPKKTDWYIWWCCRDTGVWFEKKNALASQMLQDHFKFSIDVMQSCHRYTITTALRTAWKAEPINKIFSSLSVAISYLITEIKVLIGGKKCKHWWIVKFNLPQSHIQFLSLPNNNFIFKTISIRNVIILIW